MAVEAVVAFMVAGEVVSTAVVAAVVFMVEAGSAEAFTAVESEADSEGELPRHLRQVPEHQALQLLAP